MIRHGCRGATKEDLREGRIDANRLVDLLVTFQRELQAATS
jgi:hypothetical protein